MPGTTIENWKDKISDPIRAKGLDPKLTEISPGVKTKLAEIVGDIHRLVNSASSMRPDQIQAAIGDVHRKARLRQTELYEELRKIKAKRDELQAMQAQAQADLAAGLPVKQITDQEINNELLKLWDINSLRKERAIIDEILSTEFPAPYTHHNPDFSITLADMRHIAESVYDEATEENRTRTFPEGEKRNESPNEAIALLIQEFFDRRLLLLDTTSVIEGQLTPEQQEIIDRYQFLLQKRDILKKASRESDGMPIGLSDREKLLQIKARYIESSLYSLLAHTFVTQINSRTLGTAKLSEFKFKIEGFEQELNTNELISRITSTDKADERVLYINLDKDMKTAIFFLDEYLEAFKKVIHADGPDDYVKAMPDSTESQQFDPERLAFLANIPPLQNRDVNEHRQWEFEPENDDGIRENLFHKLNKAAYVVFRNTRYTDGFLPNTATFDLYTYLGLDKDPNKKIEDLVPSNWRIPNGKGRRSDLIAPTIFITPRNTPGKLELLPAAITAKPLRHTERIQRWKQIPQEVKSQSIYQWPKEENNQEQFATHLVHMWMEISHYSPNTDHPLEKTTKVTNDLMTSEVGDVEGKTGPQKLNRDIAFKYGMAKSEDDKREAGRFGKINLAVGGTYGPVIVPDYFTFHVLQGEDPRNPREEYVGSIRDWVVRAKGDPYKIPWEKLPQTATFAWTQARNHLTQLFAIGEKGDLGGDITALAEFKYKEGIITGLNDKMLDNLANLSRLVNTYVVNTYTDARKVAPEAKDLWKTDYFMRLIIRNAKTGEIEFVDSSLYQYYNVFPFRLLNQVSSQQISDLWHPIDNPRGRHFARMIPTSENPWEYAAQLAEQSNRYKASKDPRFVPKINPAEWRDISHRYPRMPIMVVNVDPNEKGEMQDPNMFLAKDTFLGIIGAASSRGDIFERMNRPQKVIFGMLFSQEVRDMFRFSYFKGVGQKNAREFMINVAGWLFGERGKLQAEKTFLQEVNPSSVLNDWFSYSEILRFFDGQFETRQTIPELIGDKNFREEMAAIFGPIVGK